MLNKDILKNKKVLAFAGIGVLCILLLALSSGIKKDDTKENKQPLAETPEEETEEKESWDELHKGMNPLEGYDYEEEQTIPITQVKEEAKTKEPETPSPSFISVTTDTIIWNQGVYVKIADLKKMNEPDTIIVDGKTYIEKI